MQKIMAALSCEGPPHSSYEDLAEILQTPSTSRFFFFYGIVRSSSMSEALTAFKDPFCVLSTVELCDLLKETLFASMWKHYMYCFLGSTKNVLFMDLFTIPSATS